MDIRKTIENLKKNGIEVHTVDTQHDVVPLLKTILKTNCSVSVGGSMTLTECGVIDFLREGLYHFYDRYADNLTQEDIVQIYTQAYSSDVYMTSTNAITEQGELYNVDGRSNRISAIAYGAQSVIIVAGINKIVTNLDEAVIRVKRIAAPKNCQRLGMQTFCAEKGYCVSLETAHNPAEENAPAQHMTEGCNSPHRICCNYLVSARQRTVGRIKLILIGEKAGY